VAVLIGPGTVSAAEDFLIPLRTGNRATLIGEKTAGTTGQPLMVDLPGGRQARICAKRDSYPNGKEFVGVGVIPDIEVKPTREDIALGRDVVLASAIEILRSRVTSQPSSASSLP
jgi:C-terminal processing protease CtpA/Prc